MMLLEPDGLVGGLRLGRSSPDDCIKLYGEPRRREINAIGFTEYDYQYFIMRFEAGALCECTLLPGIAARIAGVEVSWDKKFLREMCERDGAPLQAHGFIILRTLGLMATGIQDDDPSQFAITAFRHAALDPLIQDAERFDFKQLQVTPINLLKILYVRPLLNLL